MCGGGDWAPTSWHAQAPASPLDICVLSASLLGCTTMLSYSACFHLMTSSHIWLNTHSNSPIFVGRVLSTPQKKLRDLLGSFFTFISTIFYSLQPQIPHSSGFHSHHEALNPPLPPALQQKSHCFSLASLLLLFPLLRFITARLPGLFLHDPEQALHKH